VIRSNSMVLQPLNKRGDKRGLYTRETCKCPYCGRVCKGKQSLSKHVNSAHSDQSTQMIERVVELAKDTQSLKQAFKSLSDVLEEGGSFDLPPTYIEELHRQDAKVQLGVRIMRCESLRRSLVKCISLSELDKRLRSVISDDSVLGSMSPIELSKLISDVERSVKMEREFLASTEEAGAVGEFTVSRLVDSLGEAGKNLALGSVNAVPNDDLVPDNPREREKLRREVLTFKQRVSV